MFFNAGVKKRYLIALDTMYYCVIQCCSMADNREIIITFRPTTEDRKILSWLKKKLGANTAGIIRQAIRALKDKEEAGPQTRSFRRSRSE
jgi:hypothetical protein